MSARREIPVEAQRRLLRIAKNLRVSMDDLTGPGRQRELVEARHIAMYVIRVGTDLSLPEIGRLFGDRDHTTVLHAVMKVAGVMDISSPSTAFSRRVESCLDAADGLNPGRGLERDL